jgi:endonuclease/exonuclease/phosphatase family metal-dependent hydrolase
LLAFSIKAVYVGRTSCTPMKIATHNVEFLFDEGEHEHSGQKWNYTPEYVEARIAHLSKLFAEIDADILFLQEVGSKSMLDRIVKRSGLPYSVFCAVPGNYGVGNAVLYKPKDCVCDSIPATTSLPVFFEGDKDTIGARVWSRRDFVRVKTNYDGKPLHLIGLHIKSGFSMGLKRKDNTDYPMETQMEKADGLIRSEFFRFTQARKVRQVVDELFTADPNAAIIVTGDFNSDEKFVPFRIIRGEAKTAPDALFSAAHKVPEAERFTGLRKGKGLLIDHILYSKVLEPKVLSTKIFNKNLGEHKNLPPTPTFVESDHAPILVELA